MHSVSNDTKWNELREAMLAIPAATRPKWRCLSLNGFESSYDGEWFYHFQDSGYADVRHVDVKSPNETTDEAVLAAIRSIGLAASRVDHFVWRIYGYVDDTNLATTP